MYVNLQRIYPERYRMYIFRTARMRNFVGYRLPVYAEHPHDLAPDLVWVDPEVGQHARGHPLGLPDQPEQDILSADVLVAEAHSFLLREPTALRARPINRSNTG
jgi:hypothetical protein